MNLKIAKTLLVLLSTYLLGFYILKFIFPHILLLQITSQNVINFGKFIESNIIFEEIYYLLSTFITFYLYVCASKGSFKISFMQFIYIVIAVIINDLVSVYLQELAVHTSTSLMLLLALLCKAELKYSTISFIVYGYCSQFLFSIRGFETIITQTNIASYFVLSAECYVWLLLFAILFNIIKGGNKDESCASIS